LDAAGAGGVITIVEPLEPVAPVEPVEPVVPVEPVAPVAPAGPGTGAADGTVTTVGEDGFWSQAAIPSVAITRAAKKVRFIKNVLLKIG